MEDVFEPLAGGGVGENAAGQFIAAQSAVRPDDFGAEGCSNLSERRLAGLNDLPRQVVGVHHRTPRDRRSWAEVDLPMPMPPVRPRTFI